MSAQVWVWLGVVSVSVLGRKAATYTCTPAYLYLMKVLHNCERSDRIGSDCSIQDWDYLVLFFSVHGVFHCQFRIIVTILASTPPRLSSSCTTHTNASTMSMAQVSSQKNCSAPFVVRCTLQVAGLLVVLIIARMYVCFYTRQAPEHTPIQNSKNFQIQNSSILTTTQSTQRRYDANVTCVFAAKATRNAAA